MIELLRLEEGHFKSLKVVVELDITKCENDREYMVRDLSQITSFEDTTEE
jgi:hypothetical protein